MPEVNVGEIVVYIGRRLTPGAMSLPVRGERGQVMSFDADGFIRVDWEQAGNWAVHPNNVTPSCDEREESANA